MHALACPLRIAMQVRGGGEEVPTAWCEKSQRNPACTEAPRAVSDKSFFVLPLQSNLPVMCARLHAAYRLGPVI